MHAFEYGIRNFNKKYQPAPNIVVFNDHIVFQDDREAPDEEQFVPNLYPSSYSYREVKHLDSNKYDYEVTNKEIIDGNIMDDYYIVNGHVTTREDVIIKNVPPYTVLDDPTFYTELHGAVIYKYEDKYYVKTQIASLGGEAAVEAVTPSTSKLFSLYDRKLRELLENPKLSLLFFFAKDGAKLESAQINIDNVKDNEIIFFLEKDDSYNIFGSVARVLSGKNINSISIIPYRAVAHLANVFNVDTRPKQIKKVCKGHLEAKKTNEEKGFFYYLGQVADFVIELTAGLVKAAIADPLIFIGEGISANLRFDEKRWRYFNEDGNLNKDFAPIIPGFETFLEIVDTINENVEKNSANFKSKLNDVEKDIKSFLDKIPIDSIKDYLKDKLTILFDVIEKMRDVYDAMVKFLSSKEIYLFVNGLLIGLLNSISAAVGGILTMVGHIISLPYYLYQAAKSDNKSGYVSMVIELLENGIEAVIKLFSFKNLAAIANFFIEAPKLVIDLLSSPSAIMTKVAEAGTYVKTHSDAIGYGIGYAIGFIIEEIVTTMATMGGATVAKAIQVNIDAFKSILKATGQFTEFVFTSPKVLVDGMSLLFKRIRKLDVPGLMDEFLAFLKSLLATAKQLADEAYIKLFDVTEQRLFKKMGYTPSSYTDNVFNLCPIGKKT
ncbi:MAG: hypothetical protein AB8B65_02655 [Kordia sp.]|uniref:hypothetical protein n=1 Tax=Kordia sp. TaxID=1965332 RepID=UPI00385E0047